MKYTISPSDNGLFILLKVKGRINSKSAMEMNLEAHALGRKLNINRYLVDVTEARNTESPAQTYKFAYGDVRGEDAIDKTAVVATLVDPDDHSHDFMETVAVNAGLNVKIFREMKAAMRYVLGDQYPSE